ncbi:MAG TPA: D-arabinono-1,4-lactone oxidase [Solirubrobacteraceae bacterium]|jgi:FAD/FMN-containing dehydrogenase|nr:D-arabinono-1,4-lactone oxidase [Solirubrobacteraceae bacterium]
MKARERSPRRLRPRLLGGFTRRRWENDTGNQTVDPVRVMHAGGVDDLVAAVGEARDAHLTVRCAGSGHSWSDVALTTGYLITPEELTGVDVADPSLLVASADAGHLVCVRSGTTIREVNAWLDGQKLGLIQMGGFDGQTFVGAAATSTHGSGVTFPPLCDYIRSVDLVDGTGACRRIEPAGGVTDAAAFARTRPGWTLDQRDDWFDAAICGMGCLGLIASAIIEVRDRFELTEVRTLSTWTQVKADFGAGAPGRYEHYEVYINPYARGKGALEHRCIVTTRQPPGTDRGSGHRPIIPELLGDLPWITALIMRLAGAIVPSLIPVLLDTSLSAITSKGYTNVSYRVFNIGSANNVRAYSAEMAVPTANDVHIEAMDRVLEVAEEYRRRGAIYHTSPISMRFVAPSRASVSMMEGRETMMIELIQLVDTDGGMEILAAHEEALADLGVRPHWGQINTVSAAELVGRYPRRGEWDGARRALDPDGLFAGPFSKRVGITARGVRC